MRLRLLSFLVLVSVLIGVAAPLAARPAAEPLCFPGVPGIVDCIDGALREYWERNGGLQVFGYPLGPALPEETPEGLFVTQHFERNRLELHPEKNSPYHVLLGRLGAERLAQLGRGSLPTPPAQPQPGCHFFGETGHNVCGTFLDYWRSHGLDLGDQGISFRESLALFGYPLAEPELETNSSGHTVLTQWFERARFEHHPDNPEPYKVLLGLLDGEVQAGQVPAAPQPGCGSRSPDRAWFSRASPSFSRASTTIRLNIPGALCGPSGMVLRWLAISPAPAVSWASIPCVCLCHTGQGRAGATNAEPLTRSCSTG